MIYGQKMRRFLVFGLLTTIIEIVGAILITIGIALLLGVGAACITAGVLAIAGSYFASVPEGNVE